MMDENLDLVQYTNRGRPSNAQRLKTPRQTKIELCNLKKQMNYKDGTEILLAISLVLPLFRNGKPWWRTDSVNKRKTSNLLIIAI